MSRNLTTAVKNQFLAVSYTPILLAEIELITASPQTYVRVWTGYGSLSWDGKTWSGIGTLGGISTVNESTEVRADGVQLSLSGVPANMIATALDEVVQGKPVAVYLGVLDSAGAVIVDPYRAFRGRVDACDIEEGGETAVIQVGCENRLIDLQRPRLRNWTNADQQQEYAGDRGFEYVPQLQELNLIWGKGSPIPQFAGGGGVPDDSDRYSGGGDYTQYP